MNRFEMANRTWDILVRSAQKHEIGLTYAELAEKLGVGMALASRHGLHLIFELCQEKGYPHLTCLVFNKSTKLPSEFFLASLPGNLEAERQEAYAMDWSKIPAPFGEKAARAQLTKRKIEPEDFFVPDQFVKVNGRGPYQSRFREILWKAYEGQCSVCDTCLPSMLVASHIVPWSYAPKHRLNPRNGLILCRVHDALFETGEMLIHPDLQVVLDLPQEKLVGKDFISFILEATAKSVRPQRGKGPDPELLRERLRLISLRNARWDAGAPRK